VNPAVQGYAAAVVDTLSGDERDRLVADIAAVDRELARNPELRAALTDVVVPGRARRAVVAELLDHKVGGPAKRLCAYAAGAVRAQEVPAAITWLAHRLRQVHDTPDTEEQSLGHLSARMRVGGYAAALFEDVSSAELDEVEDQLFRFSRMVATTPELRSALGDRDLPARVRRALVDDLLSGKVHAATQRLVDYAVVGGRARDIVGTLDWLVEQTAAARGWRVARVRAGQQVTEEEREKLERTLRALAGAPVELQVTVDPKLLAGVNIQIGDLQLDETARGRLDRLREHMTTGEWTDLGFSHAALDAHRAAAAGTAGATGARPAAEARSAAGTRPAAGARSAEGQPSSAGSGQGTLGDRRQDTGGTRS